MNAKGFTVATSGAGSIGLESTVFGSLTKSALIEYQIANAIFPIAGYFGPITRGSLCNSKTVFPVPASVPTINIFISSLSFGSTGQEVIALQDLLKSLGYFYADSTGYFGPLTKAAIVQYQLANGLEGVGLVGPLTRASLNARVANIAAIAPSAFASVQHVSPVSVSATDSETPRRRSGGSRPSSNNEVITITPDTTAPVISSIASSTSQTDATVTWSTNEAANSTVAYGTSTGMYTASTSSFPFVVSHSLEFSGLSTSTLYYYVVVSSDSSGNVSTSTEMTLTTDAVPDTTAPALPTNVNVINTNTTNSISWTDPKDGDLASINIYSGTSSGSLLLLATVSAGDETYADSPVVNDTSYYYALSSVDAEGNESSQTTEVNILTQTYFEAASDLFNSTGRVAVWADASNPGASITGQVGSNRNSGEWGPLVGSPIYIMAREMSANTWLGYEIVTSGSTEDQIISHTSQSIYKPAKFIRFDAGTTVADNGAGAAAPIPLDAAGNNKIRFKLNTLDTSVTDLSLAVVYQSANIDKLVKVTITGASQGAVTPNLMQTAAQAVTDGWLSSTALVSNGGSIEDDAYVLQTNVSGRIRLKNSGFQSVPLAANLSPDDYTVTATVTTVGTNGESSATSRAYIGGLFYHSDSITESTSGAVMARMGYVSSANDGSTDEVFYLSGRPVASGSNVAIGKSHGYETQTQEPALLVDGVTYRMSGKISTRSRSSNVALIKTLLPHGLSTGDVITTSSFASTTYSKNEVAVTVIDTTSFSYVSSGSNEAEIADASGRFIRKGIKLGSSSISLSQPSQLFHPNYNSGNTPIGTMDTTYVLSGKTLSTRANGSLGIAFRHNSSFGVLATYWSDTQPSRGPTYSGLATGKVYTPELTHLALDNDAGLEVLDDKSLTFLISRPTSDISNVINITSTTGNDAFSGNWRSFIQDRSGGGVEKLYLRLPGAGTVDTDAGWSFDYSTNRIDGFAPGAKSSSLFVD